MKGTRKGEEKERDDKRYDEASSSSKRKDVKIMSPFLEPTRAWRLISCPV